MESEAELKIIKANSEVASVISQWRVEKLRKTSIDVARPSRLQDRSPAITNPAGFWSAALTSTGGISAVEIEQSVRLTAAKINTGDVSFVVESALGQIAWLSSLALEFKQDADEQPVESASRIRLLNLSLRAQNTAAKLMMSLGALSKVNAGESLVLSG